MTADRKKAILIMGATFIAGVIIGVLSTGIFARQFYHGRDPRGGKKEMRDGRRGTFTDKIFRVVEADSAQRKQMTPIIDQTTKHIDQLEDQTNKDAYAALDSMKFKLQPMLNESQREKLEKFLASKRKAHEEEERREHEHDHGRH